MSDDTDWKLPWDAGCRCDRIRMRISAPPMFTAACHCTGCQRMTASAYSLTVTVPTEGFAVTQGEPVIGALHGIHKHYYCDFCKSWLFTKPHQLDFFVNVRATMLDNRAWFRPIAETMRAEGYPWATTGAEFSFADGGPTTVDGYTPILTAFKERGPRPA